MRVGNGDGKSDIVWRDTELPGPSFFWFMDEAVILYTGDLSRVAQDRVIQRITPIP